ncbi:MULTISPECIES: hypothetical protein [Vibrio]|uniref:hypothetical protein n=1 Tax=Vibrio TaxID=662 RepID=UPI000B5C52A3|nr:MULTISPECIES: hypothetical protein [Vibrio]HBV77637.1 hypothetical protein [Vibrio sp.]
MSFIYHGFFIEDMLICMAKHEKNIIINLEYIGFDYGWKLTVANEEHGRFEEYGHITTLVTKAFKPYLPEAKIKFNQLKKVLSGTIVKRINGYKC